MVTECGDHYDPEHCKELQMNKDTFTNILNNGLQMLSTF